MPTQPTQLTAGTMHDPAGFAPDVSVACAADAARLEKDAVGPPSSLVRFVQNLPRRCWHAFRERHRARDVQIALHQLSERELIDIGIARTEIEHIAARRTIEKLRDGTLYPWMR